MKFTAILLASTGSVIMTACATAGTESGIANSPDIYSSILTVTDTDAIGTLGDTDLSFDEAVKLANGALSITALSEAEQANISGEPGAEKPDLIRFNVIDGTVRFPLQIQQKPEMDFSVLVTSSKLDPLVGNDGDTILGDGIRFTNGPDDARDTVNEIPLFKGAPLGGTALTVQSSGLTIKGVTFERFIQSLDFSPPADADVLADVKLLENRFHNGGGVSFGGVTAAGERGELRNILVKDNEFLGPIKFGEHFPSKFHNAIGFSGATAQAAKSSGEADVILRNLEVSDNIIEEFAGGVQAQPVQTMFAPNAGGRLDGLKIVGNSITLDAHAPDPAIYIWGGVAVNGEISRANVSDVLIQENKISGNGFVVFVVGAEALLGGTTPSSDIHMSNVRIVNNHISPRSACSYGITTIPAFPEMNGPPATNTSLSNFEIRGNTVDGCRVGAFATPVLNIGAPGTNRGNWIDGLLYEDNIFTGGETGILVAGGALVSDVFEGSTIIEDNELRNLRIIGNNFDMADTAILLTGGFGTGAGQGDIANNRVFVSEISGNVQAAENGAILCSITPQLLRKSAANAEGNIVRGVLGQCSDGVDRK